MIFAAAAALLLGMTSVSYLAETDSSVTLTIQAFTYSTSNGKPTNVADTSEPALITVGKAQKVAGHQLFRVHVGDLSLSDKVLGYVLWLNSYEATQVLSNPNSYIEVGFYRDTGTAPTGSPVTGCPEGEFKTPNQLGADICVTSAAPGNRFETELLTPILAEGIIKSTAQGYEYLYVIATIYIPGGAPPGQQPLSGTLGFELLVKLSGG